MAVITGLISWWSLDEASGSALDSHGTTTLTDNNTVASAVGLVSGARDFEVDNNERFSVSDNASVSVGDIDFEFAGWVKAESYPGVNGVVGKFSGDNANDEYLLFYWTGINSYRWQVWNTSSSATSVDSTFGAFSTGTWYFVTCGHDSVANNIFITVNAGTPDVAPHSTGVRDGTTDFTLGTFVSSYLDGLLDEWGFWKKVLTPAERTWLYNAGAGRSYADIVAEAGGSTPDPVMSRGRRWNVQRRRNVFRSRAA